MSSIGPLDESERRRLKQVAAELVRQARERGLSLTGPDGLLKQLTKSDSS